MPYSWVCYGCSWSGSWFEKIDANRYSCTKSLFPFCLLLLLNCNAAAFFFSSYLRLLIHWLRILSWCATPIQWHIWSILSYSLSFFSSFFFFLFSFSFSFSCKFHTFLYPSLFSFFRRGVSSLVRWEPPHTELPSLLPPPSPNWKHDRGGGAPVRLAP